MRRLSNWFSKTIDKLEIMVEKKQRTPMELLMKKLMIGDRIMFVLPQETTISPVL